MPFSPEELSELKTSPIDVVEDVTNRVLHDKDFDGLSQIADLALEHTTGATGLSTDEKGRYGQLFFAVDYVLAGREVQTTGQQG